MKLAFKFAIQGWQKSIYLLTVLLVSACGGGGSGGGSDNSPNDNNPPTQNPPVIEEPITPDPVVPTEPTTPENPDPVAPAEPVISTSNPLPPAKTLASTAMSELAVASITTQNGGSGNLELSWPENASEQYRVLYWSSDGQTHEIITTSNSATLDASTRNLGGQLVIESMDDMGNSVFSSPVVVEAL